MSNEILLRGDCHIYPHASNMERAKDCLEAYEWTYQEALKNNIKVVIDLGDVFHERSHVDSFTHSSVYEISKKYHSEHGIKTIFILGNHDMYFREGGRYSSIVSFESLGEVVASPKTIEIYGKKIDCLPYVENSVGKTLLESFPLGNRHDILLFHCSIENALLSKNTGMRRTGGSLLSNSSMQEEEIDETIAPEMLASWKIAIGGHYHCPQKIENIHYVGSPIQHTFGEVGEDKRVMILDLDTLQYRSIYNDFSPKFLDINEETDLSQIPEDISRSSVRITCKNPMDKDILQLKKKLGDRGVKNIKVNVDTKALSDTKRDKIVSNFGINIGTNLETTCHIFIKMSGHDNQEELMEVLRKNILSEI